MSSIKLPVSRHAIHYLEQRQSSWLDTISRTRGRRMERLFWQSGGGYDRNITCVKTLVRMIDYVHLNPVRRGLVDRACQWQWSSAAWFEGGVSPITLDSIPSEWLTE